MKRFRKKNLMLASPSSPLSQSHSLLFLSFSLVSLRLSDDNVILAYLLQKKRVKRVEPYITREREAF
jgi:hypothetical protein